MFLHKELPNFSCYLITNLPFPKYLLLSASFLPTQGCPRSSHAPLAEANGPPRLAPAPYPERQEVSSPHAQNFAHPFQNVLSYS